ncbi:MAG: glycosyltransferase family 2 protein [Candidatus Methanomethylicia archaeon]|jgi:cellulose synthase/poly-beta-1,6-N-acetylglucosamine synthase-like glycosyltransferase|nr:glycosyltransferase family 2 protein [Candidatus Methanomethylicia archaeon]
MSKILAIIPVLSKYPKETIESLLSQTIKPSKIVVAAGSQSVCKDCSVHGVECYFIEPDLTKHVEIRVAKAINFALQFTNVNDYDYILKVDDDVSLPPNFIELSLKLDADCVGGSGCAQMFKISTFMALFKGRFPEVVSDDTYCEFMIIACGKKYAKWPIERI